MKASHYPGPWMFALDEQPDGKDFITIEKEGCPICEVRGTDDMSCIDEDDEERIAEECKANAHLIAAAPELLEALVSIIGMAEDGHSLHKRNASHQELLEEDREALSKARNAIKKAKGL